MRKFLSFIFAMVMITPAFAESFPNDELMQENKTYDNAAIYDNTGVYSGDVDADPEFDWTQINVTAGNYLPQSATSTAQCTAGNYCTGLQNTVHYDDTQNQGLTSCATLGDGSFIHSAVASRRDTQCYKLCTQSNIENSLVISGNDYYGNGTDTCAATSCKNGYSVNSGSCNANTLNITWNGVSSETVTNANAGTCTYGGAIRTPPAPPHIPGKTFVGWRFKKPSYTAVEYVENASNTRVDTGIIPNQDNVVMEIKVKPTNGSWYIFQNRYNTDNNRYIYGILGGVNGNTIGTCNLLVKSTIIRNTDHIYIIRATIIKNQSEFQSTLYVHDLTSDTEDTRNGTCGYLQQTLPLQIFSNQQPGDGGYPNASLSGNRVYYARVWVNGDLVLDYIPAVVNNTAGFWDKITKTFRTASQGSLTAGPEI